MGNPRRTLEHLASMEEERAAAIMRRSRALLSLAEEALDRAAQFRARASKLEAHGE